MICVNLVVIHKIVTPKVLTADKTEFAMKPSVKIAIWKESQKFTMVKLLETFM